MKQAEVKMFAIGVRHNPQIGSYFYDLIIGTRMDNKVSISLKYEKYGDRRSMKFSQWADAKGRRCCLERDASVYGSVEYIAFDTAAAAIEFVRERSDYRRAKEYIETLKQAA